MGQIKIKDHLSPAEAEVGAELGKVLVLISFHSNLYSATFK